MKTKRSILALASFLVLTSAPRAAAQCTPGPHAGAITADQTWCAGLHTLTGDVTVALGVTLTLQPGVTVEAPANVELMVQGNLIAPGTAAQPIEMKGDAGGQWTGLVFDGSAGPGGGTGTLSHCTVRQGGNSSSIDPYRGGMVVKDVGGAGVSFTSCTFSDSGRPAWVVRSRASFASCTFSGAGVWPLTVEGASSVLDLTASTFTGSSVNRVFLTNGALTGQSFTLKKQTQLDAYHLDGKFAIPAGITLTVEPGVRLVGYPNEELKILGHLEAVGAPADPITFTAADGVQWTGLIVAGGTANLVQCVVEKGDNSSSVDPYRASLTIVDVQAGTVSVTSSTIGARSRGAWVVRSRASFAGTTFTGASISPLTIEGASSVLDLTNDTFTGNVSNRVLIEPGAMSGADFTLTKQTTLDAYQLNGSYIVPAGRTMTVAPGVKVVGTANVGLVVQGRLVAQGTATDPITFSDSGTGEWTGLGFDGGTGTLSYCTVLRGGDASPMDPYRGDIAAHLVPAPGLLLDHCTVDGTLGIGMRISDSVVGVSDSTFTNAGTWPLWVQGASTVLSLSGNSFVGNSSNRVLIDPGAMSGADFTLANQTALDAYQLNGHYFVPPGRTMTVAPGVKVVGTANVGLVVQGRLVARGSAADPITFADAGSGQWTGLVFDGGTGDLAHCTVARGGNASPIDPYRGNIAARNVQSGDLRLDACRLTDGALGLRLFNSRVTADALTVDGMSQWPVVVEGATTALAMTNATIDLNTNNRVYLVDGAMMAADTTLRAQTKLEGYQLGGSFHVPAGVTLSVEPGVTVMAGANEGLYVRGRLLAVGTPSSPVVFRSTGTMWTGVAFDGGGGLLRHAVVMQGGNASEIDPWRGSISIRELPIGELRIENSLISSANASGVTASSSRVTLVNTVVRDNGAEGVRAANDAVLTALNTTFASNNVAVSCGSGSTCTLTNTIVTNSPNGVVNDGTSTATLSHTLWDGVGTPTSGPVTVQGSIIGPAALAADGVHLTAASMALEQGIPTDVADDFDDEVRPQPAGTLRDLGADEAVWPAPLGRTATPIALGETKNGTTPATGFSDFVLNLASGAVPNLQVRLVAPGGVANVRLLARNRQFPMEALFDFEGTVVDATTKEILVPAPLPGSWYLSALSSAGSVPFTITVAGAERGLSSISPSSGGNAGSVVAEVEGVGFEPGSRVELRASGVALRSYMPVSQSSTRLTVRMNLSGLPPSTCDIAVIWPNGEERVLNGAFQILSGGQGTLETEMFLPGAVRAGRPATLVLTYRNTGTVDMAAPLLEIRSVQNVPMRLDASYAFRKEPFRVLGIGSGIGTAGTLSPGDVRTIPFQVIPEGPAHSALDFEVYGVTDASTVPITWAPLESELTSTEIDRDAWTQLWGLFRADVGPTWADWVTALRRTADALSANRRFVFDPARLTASRMVHLAGYGIPTNLSIALDADAPAPGPPLGVLRSYPNSILSRSRLGPFGRGWRNALWETTLAVSAKGEVVLRGGSNEMRRFWPRTDGGYDGMPDDPGRLTTAAGGFTLTETDLTVLAFRPDGRLGSIVDRFGNRADLTYDASGHLTRVGHTTGDHLDLLWNGQGRIVQLTDHAGRVTTYDYDASGELLTAVTAPGGRAWHYGYAPVTGSPSDRALTSITFPDGTHRYFEYDAAGRFARRTADGGAEPVSFAYTSLVRMTTTDGAGNTSTAAFDEIGRLVGTSDASGVWGWLTHDARGNVVHASGPDGAEADLDYGPMGELSHLVDPLGHESFLRRTYTAGGGVFVRGLVDPMSNASTIEMGSRHEPTALNLPDGSRWELASNGIGEFTSVRNRRGQTVLYSYNARSQVVRKEVPGASPIVYDYDAAGRLALVTGPEGTYTFDYDARDFLVRLSEPSGRAVSWEYDDGGKQTRRTTSDGSVVTYGWDAAGRLSEVRLGDGTLLSRYTYDSAGRISRQERGNGTYTTWEHDVAGRTLSIVHHAPGGAVQDSLTYERDQAGRPIRMTSPGGVTSWAWDALGRLIRVEEPSSRTVTYAYDAAGSRTEVVDNAVSTLYASNALNQVTSAGAASFTYDADGNVLTRTDTSGTTTYEWDPEGRLVGATHPTSGSFQYTFDSLGRLATEVNGATTTRFEYDDRAIESERDGTGALVTRYAQGYGLLARLPASGPTAYYGFDLAGSTRLMTDGTGAVTNRYELGPFGEPRTAVEGIPNPFRFSGAFGVRTEALGLIRMGARPYDPSLGRFLAPDPIGYAAGYHLYAYCGNAPVHNADPSGLEKIGGDLQAAGKNLFKSLLSATGQKGASALYGLLNAPGTMGKALKEVLDGCKSGDVGAVSHGIGTFSWALGSSVSGAAIPIIEAGQAALWGGGATVVVGGVALAPVLAITGIVIFADEVFTDLYLESIKQQRAFLERGPAPRNAYAMWPDQIREDGTLPPELLDLWRRFHGMDVVQPGDPNEKLATPGAGPRHRVRSGDRLSYIVRFENVPSASAPAQEAVVDDVLDPSLDLSTLEVVSIGWGDRVVDVVEDGLPVSRRETVPDYRPTSGRRWFVDVSAGRSGDRLRLTLRTIDPTTNDLPEDALAGFLPPNDATGRGQGFLEVSVRTKTGLSPGTRIANSATIVFDTQPPITTAEVFNTIGISGDVNDDGVVNPADVFYLVNFFYSAGPTPLGIADVNNDGRVDALDLFYLINYLYAAGPAPL